MPFQPGNSHAAAGGRARAEALSPGRRSEIARLGFEATTQQYFDGDAAAHTQWFVEAGLAAQDSNYPKWMRVFRTPDPHQNMFKMPERRLVSPTETSISRIVTHDQETTISNQACTCLSRKRG